MVVFGLFVLLSASSYASEQMYSSPYTFFLSQFGAGLFALLICVITSFINYRHLRHLGLLICIGSIVALLLVNFSSLGINVGGSERWLNLGIITVQPSEVAKAGVLILMADGLSRASWNSIPVYLRLIICGLISYLVLIEPDLGSTIMIVLIVGFLLFIAGMSLLVACALLALAFAAVIYVIQSNPYQQERVIAWLSPENDPLGIGYNLLQAYYAVAEGGILGVGYGNSFFKLGYLPVGYSDFIFPIICEELGVFGAGLAIGLFVAILWYGMSVAVKAPCSFGKLLASGIVFTIIMQAIFNMGGVTGVIPITGIPLPFVSYGKTSLVVLGFLFGILISISRYTTLVQKGTSPKLISDSGPNYKQ